MPITDKCLWLPLLALGAALLPQMAVADEANRHQNAAACNRACLTEMIGTLTSSIVDHDAARVPLTAEYAATENSIPAALPMMTIWHSVTAFKTNFLVIDPVSGQVFLAAGVSEGQHDSLLFGRVKIVDRKFSEIELYLTRSRSDAGFQFGPVEWATPPAAWTMRIPAARLPSRADLLAAGRSIFDPTIASPNPAPGCLLMENGKLVAENPDVLKLIMPPGAPAGPPLPVNPDGSVSIPCGNPPDRPADPAARTDVVDEEQGIVVSIATIQGMTEPYLITRPTISAYIPLSLARPYTDMLARQRAAGTYDLPALRAMAGSQTVAQMHRIYDGKLQAMQMFQKIGPVGGRSPWVVKAE